jgi:ABC-type branched-subunit amino acid transport system ATPase component
MLEVTDLRASHGPVQVLRGVSLSVPAGQVVAVVGGNGAGKTTLARAVAGMHRDRTGVIRVGDRDVSSCGPVRAVQSGVALVPQGRRLFGSLTVAEHFTLARARARSGAMSTDGLLDLFPRLGERMRVRARFISGGEQQMLAIARAVLLGPDVLVLDEPTEGLAPAVVELVAGLVRRLRQDGVAVLLMEQDSGFPVHIADQVLTLDRGVLGGRTGPPAQARHTSHEEDDR